MSARIYTECPHCHHRGTISYEVEPGRKIRCASCRKPFTFGPGIEIGDGEPGMGETAPSGPAQSRCPDMPRHGMRFRCPYCSSISQSDKPIPVGLSIRCERCQISYKTTPELEVAEGEAASSEEPVAEKMFCRCCSAVISARACLAPTVANHSRRKRHSTCDCHSPSSFLPNENGALVLLPY